LLVESFLSSFVEDGAAVLEEDAVDEGAEEVGEEKRGGGPVERGVDDERGVEGEGELGLNGVRAASFTFIEDVLRAP